MRIATRKSLLALWQSEHAADLLRRHHEGLAVELVPLSTRGDEVLDRSLSEIGGKGVFLKELERAMLDGEADIAVHSLKDVPAESPPEFELAVYLPAADWGDWWITRDGGKPSDMPPGTRVGTSSLRRQSQLLARHPELDIVPVRGNVQTRLAKLDGGEVDALILAAAGLKRLEIQRAYWHPLTPPEFLPAPGQGVVVVQCRRGDDRVRRLLEPLNCAVTTIRVQAERAVVHELGGDCRMPLAALAQVEGERVRLHARLASPDGTETIDARVEGAAEDADDLGRKAARSIIEGGGKRILSQL
jgi:hydroxymethylbilane synthase